MRTDASKILALIAAAALSGCAQPKYESTSTPPGGLIGQDVTQEIASTCSLKFKTSKVCIKWQWEKQPTSSVNGSFVMKLFRGNLYDDSLVLSDVELQPQVVLWMPTMGHGSTPTTVSRLDVGTYRVANVFFIMPGAWEIRIQLKDGADVVDEAIISLTI